MLRKKLHTKCIKKSENEEKRLSLCIIMRVYKLCVETKKNILEKFFHFFIFIAQFTWKLLYFLPRLW